MVSVVAGKGDKLLVNDVVWRQLKKLIAKSDVSAVRVGVLAEKGGSKEHDSESGATILEIATIHELGAPKAKIPERSFIRRTFKSKARQLARFKGRVAQLIIERKLTVAQGLDVIGAWGAEQVKQTITSGAHIPPPLKPATEAAKGSTRPLVDTGRLANSITHALAK